MEAQLMTNVATQSTEGHFVKTTAPVVCLDKVREAFFVEGNATLTSKNHQTLPLEKDCLLTPQVVYNPFTQMLERSKD